MNRPYRLALFIVSGSLVGVGPLLGQNLQRGYQPSRSTISPYLNLLRTNFGPLPNYHSLVRPLLQQRQFNQRATRSIDYNYRQLSARDQMSPGQLELRVSSPGIRATGTHGQFQYYSHYFPAPRSAPSRK